MTAKIIQLVKRRDGVRVEEIQAQMQEMAPRRASMAACLQYVQSHTLLQGYSKGEPFADLVEEFWFGHEDDARAALAKVVQSRPGLAHWVDFDASCELVVTPHLVKGSEVPRPAVKNIEFVTRRAAMADQPFFRYWREVHGPLASTIPSVLRYEQNHAIPALAAQPGRCDGLAITWFESTAAMRSGAQTEAYRLTRADEANFLPDGHLPIIITREVVRTGPL